MTSSEISHLEKASQKSLRARGGEARHGEGVGEWGGGRGGGKESFHKPGPERVASGCGAEGLRPLGVLPGEVNEALLRAGSQAVAETELQM